MIDPIVLTDLNLTINLKLVEKRSQKLNLTF